MMKPIWGECQLNIHTCHEFASCTDLDIGYLCECWYPFVDLNGDGRTCIDFDECSDGNHICASATNPDIKIICTNLEPTGDNYCDTSVDLKDPPGNTDEEKKFFRAMYALEGGCPGYSCQCDTSGNFIENQPKTKLTF